MRFHPAKGLATAGAIVAILMATGCSSLSSAASSASSAVSSAANSAAATPTAGGSASSTASTGTGSAGASSSSGAVGQITTNWEKFFASSTPTSERVALLQNGSTFSSAISSFAASPLAAGVAAKVNSVTVTSATQATVHYDITGPGGTTLLPAQTGTAVLQDGVWKVGDASFCGLLKVGGSFLGVKLPAACG
jgi:hypothetical protein